MIVVISAATIMNMAMPNPIARSRTPSTAPSAADLSKSAITVAPLSLDCRDRITSGITPRGERLAPWRERRRPGRENAVELLRGVHRQQRGVIGPSHDLHVSPATLRQMATVELTPPRREGRRLPTALRAGRPSAARVP